MPQVALNRPQAGPRNRFAGHAPRRFAKNDSRSNTVSGSERESDREITVRRSFTACHPSTLPLSRCYHAEILHWATESVRLRGTKAVGSVRRGARVEAVTLGSSLATTLRPKQVPAGRRFAPEGQPLVPPLVAPFFFHSKRALALTRREIDRVLKLVRRSRVSRQLGRTAG